MKGATGVKASVHSWPEKHTVLGIGVSATTYDEAVHAIVRAAKEDRPACVTALAVHGLVTATQDPHLAGAINDFQMVTPDGQPIRWALNRLYRTGLEDRVYGPELMLRVCRGAAAEGLKVYLYGSHEHVVTTLRTSLLTLYPGLDIVGSEPSLFRPLTPVEDEALIERISSSGAHIVFVGLGCPLQEQFAHGHRESVRAVQICVGAAFDFHSGNKKMAPSWMQRSSLEWLYRLMQEPRRLGKRYLVTDTLFLVKLMPYVMGIRRSRRQSFQNGGHHV